MKSSIFIPAIDKFHCPCLRVTAIFPARFFIRNLYQLLSQLSDKVTELRLSRIVNQRRMLSKQCSANNAKIA